MAKYHEDNEQAALFQWARHFKKLRWLHAIPNGGNRNPREAARLRQQGVKKGVSDIFLPMPTMWHHGLYIELKRAKKQGASRVSPEQKEFIQEMNTAGYMAVVCYGADEAIKVISEYAGIK